MAELHPLIVNVAELLRHPMSRAEVHTQVPSEGFTVLDSSVPAGTPITVDVALESLNDGIVATGRVSAPWQGACRRCLGVAGGTLEVLVSELYQARPQTDEAFPINGDLLDLEPLVREAVLLELPLAPLCRADCAGLCPECGVDRNESDCGHGAVSGDPRWAALDELRERLDHPTN
jgi:uncharacterized protein